MKLINRERRLKYLGFDDKWFVVIGIIVLSFIADYLITNSFGRDLPLKYALMGWGVSLFFSIFNWFSIREILIQLRKRFPDAKDNLKRIIIFFIAIVSVVLIVNYIGTVFLSNAFGINFNEIDRSKLLFIILISIMTMAMYEAAYYYIKLQESIREEEQAKQAIVQAQLDALRNQAQPHFFFNTLNTLRDIIDQESKEEAKDFVDKISDVYRFILESGNANLIPLRDELKFAKSYIHIQTERFGENLQLDWQIPDEMLDSYIIPMSLQLLLENAIKHNVISKARHLRIQVNVIDESLRVSNALQIKSTQLPSTKLGLKNIKSRYAIITDKAVKIEKNDGQFIVSIPLLKSSDKKLIYADSDH